MYPAIGSIVAKHHGAEPAGDAALRGVPDLPDPHRLRRLPGPRVRSVHRQPGGASCRSTTTSAWTPARRPRPTFPTARGLTHDRLKDRRALLNDLDRLRRDLDHSADVEAMDRYGQEADRAAGRPPCPGGVRPEQGARGGPRPLRQASLVPAGAARPPAGRGGRRLRDDRPELSPGLGHLGQPRRQHPALRRHQQGPRSRCCRCSITCSRRWSRDLGRARPARRRAGDRHGRVRPHADDGHAGQHRRPQPLAGRDVDGPGRRRPAARPGDRRDRAPTAATSRSGPSPPATWPPPSTATWASPSTPPTRTRTAAPGSSSNTASRSPSCSEGFVLAWVFPGMGVARVRTRPRGRGLRLLPWVRVGRTRARIERLRHQRLRRRGTGRTEPHFKLFHADITLDSDSRRPTSRFRLGRPDFQQNLVPWTSSA